MRAQRPRRPDEVDENGDEPLRVVAVREVAGVGEDLQPAPRHPLVRIARVPYGNERVLLAPDDQGRQSFGEVEAFVRAHALPAVIHHAPNRLDERAPGRGLLKRNEAAPRFVEVGARPKPDASHGVDERTHAATSRGAEPGKDGFGPRERRGPEQRVYLATEATAGDED